MIFTCRFCYDGYCRVHPLLSILKYRERVSVNTTSPQRLTQKKSNYIAARQPDFGAWIKELSELKGLDSKGVLTKGELKLFGAGLVIEEPDEELLLLWLEETCKALKIDFQVLDLDSSPDSIARLEEASLKLSVSFLKTGDWLLERCSAEQDQQTRTSLIEILRKKGSMAVVVTYCRSYVDVAECLRFEGLFDRHLRWAEHCPEVLAADFMRHTGLGYFDKSLSKDRLRLGRLLSMDYQTRRRQGILKMALQRRSRELKRPMAWPDVIELAVNGTGKGQLATDQVDPHRVSVHEAGHAVMCVVASDGKHLPEFVSILPNRFSLGQVTEGIHWAYARCQSRTFEQSLWKIKICLAGRAAEEIVFGPLGVASSSAYEDLQEASEISYRLVAQNGFHSRYGQGEDTGANLFVVDDDAPAALKASSAEESVRLLSGLYEETRKVLVGKLPFLMAISDALLESKVLLESDMTCLLQHFEDRRSYEPCQS